MLCDGVEEWFFAGSVFVECLAKYVVEGISVGVFEVGIKQRNSA